MGLIYGTTRIRWKIRKKIFVSRVITTQESKFAKQIFSKLAYPVTARISIPAVHWLPSLLLLPLMKDTLVL